MKEIIFLLLLLHLQSGDAGLNTPGKLWTTGQGGGTRTSHSDPTPSPTTAVGSPPPEIQAAQVTVSQGPPFASSGETARTKAARKTSSPTTSTPASQTDGRSRGGSDRGEMGSSSSSEGTSLQSDARQVLLQQDGTTGQDPATGHRPPREPSLSTGTASTQQDGTSRPSGFETTRGK